MEFKFYINEIEIDEPVGFDATKIKLKRSENWHGVMAEASEETIEVYGSGFDILSGLYATSGIDAVAVLKIEYYCGGILEDTIEYNITFYEYTEFCGSDCYCVVGIEKSGCFYQFKNAMDTKVDLDTLTSIDKITELADYEYLGKEIEIPSKTIVLTDSANLTEEQYQEWQTDITNTFAYPPSNYEFFIFPPLETQLSEIEIFDTNTLVEWWQNPDGGGESGEERFIFENSLNGTCNDNTEFNLTGRLKFDFYSDIDSLNANPTIRVYVFKKKLDNTYVSLYTGPDLMSNVGNVHSANVDEDIDLTINLDSGEKLLFTVRFDFSTNSGTIINEMNITFYTESFFKLTNNSSCAPTNAKLYLVNEALSHISEYVTNNCLRVYSEYLGRQDSQPFSFLNDGCGGMLGLTSGLFLRRIEDVKTDENKPIFSLTFNEVINAVNCINPLGFTVEQNGEDEVIRIEDWKYFYNESIIADLGTVSVEKTPNLKLHFKNYKTGYSKYEAEEYNGLDEFLTEREYTTRLINHDATLERVCQFVASGYAIEITRRKGNTDSKDWRYDNDTFIICLDRYYGGLEVEQGNITNDANIIDPSTILNFRISPARMALQWFQYVTTFLKSAKELIFSSGKGNTSAEGELISECSIDENVLSEKQNITQSDFILNQEGIFIPELHTISGVPFTFQQYKSLQSNPHGLFAYKCNETQLYGWLNECSYSFVDGTIDLVLIPKVI